MVLSPSEQISKSWWFLTIMVAVAVVLSLSSSWTTPTISAQHCWGASTTISCQGLNGPTCIAMSPGCQWSQLYETCSNNDCGTLTSWGRDHCTEYGCTWNSGNTGESSGFRYLKSSSSSRSGSSRSSSSRSSSSRSSSGRTSKRKSGFRSRSSSASSGSGGASSVTTIVVVIVIVIVVILVGVLIFRQQRNSRLEQEEQRKQEEEQRQQQLEQKNNELQESNEQENQVITMSETPIVVDGGDVPVDLEQPQQLEQKINELQEPYEQEDQVITMSEPPIVVDGRDVPVDLENGGVQPATVTVTERLEQ